VARVIIFLTIVALIAGMVGCNDHTSPTEIRDWYDLDAIRDNLGGSYLLINDLDSTTAGYTELASPTANEGKGWAPIGYYDDLFIGTFDGQDYEIGDLFINRPDQGALGLFGSIGEGGVIENLRVVNSIMSGGSHGPSTAAIGNLVAYSLGTVTNCYSSANLSAGWYTGGLVGYNGYLATVSNSYATGSVKGSTYVGGLVGFNEGTVANSYATCNVTGRPFYFGGLVGCNEGTVSNCYSTGTVTGMADNGGLVGVSTEGTVTNSFWDTETSRITTSAGGTGKTTTEMHDINTFSGATWDIVAVADPSTRNPSYIWNIVDGQSYPFMSWQSVS